MGLDQELSTALTAATAAANAIRDIWDRADSWVQEKENDQGPLTAADLAADAILQDILRTRFPSDGILSEEGAADPSRVDKDRVWVIDPLDGTREFVERIPEFVVSVGLAIQGVATVGVMVNPVSGMTMAGIVGGGALLNGSSVRVTTHPSLTGARVVVSRSEYKKGWFDQWSDQIEAIPVGSVAYKLGLVGTGQADATFTPKPRNEWDICAGVAIIEAAGGRASNGAGSAYRFNEPDPLNHGVVGTNGLLHPQILGLIR